MREEFKELMFSPSVLFTYTLHWINLIFIVFLMHLYPHDTSITFDENITERFHAYGGHVQSVADSNDTEAILAAMKEARKRNPKAMIN